MKKEGSQHEYLKFTSWQGLSSLCYITAWHQWIIFQFNSLLLVFSLSLSLFNFNFLLSLLLLLFNFVQHIIRLHFHFCNRCSTPFAFFTQKRLGQSHLFTFAFSTGKLDHPNPRFTSLDNGLSNAIPIQFESNNVLRNIFHYFSSKMNFTLSITRFHYPMQYSTSPNPNLIVNRI